jgi:ribosome-associated heat shock protein Hsp15
VKSGDVVTIALDRIRVLRVTGFADRRGSASDAAVLFEDLAPVVPVAKAAQDEGGPDVPRRPTKQERREILRLKRPANG